MDAIVFVQDTLTKGAQIYGANEYEACWRHYIRRGQEFIDKYSRITNKDDISALNSAIFDGQPMVQFADEAWSARNAFKRVLRGLEVQGENVKSSDLLQNPGKPKFGR